MQVGIIPLCQSTSFLFRLGELHSSRPCTMIAVVLIHGSRPWCYIVLEPGDWHFLPTAGYNHNSENLDTLGSCWWKSAVTLTLSAEAWQSRDNDHTVHRYSTRSRLVDSCLRSKTTKVSTKPCPPYGNGNTWR